MGCRPSAGRKGDTGVISAWHSADLKALVYVACMSRTNVDIDDGACAEVMRRYRLSTKREAINFALRTLAAAPATLDEARAVRGIGWEGGLDAMRSDRRP